MKWSNCLFEAIRQKLINPTNIIVYQRGSWLEIFKLKFPHFYWLDKRDNKKYHFCTNGSDNDNAFIYKGEIKRFILTDKGN